METWLAHHSCTLDHPARAAPAPTARHSLSCIFLLPEATISAPAPAADAPLPASSTSSGSGTGGGGGGLSPASPSFAPPAAAAADDSNPLLALQTVVAGELAPIKQRSRAAQQLESHFRALAAPSPALFAAFEPYLSLLVAIATAPAKATREVQESVSRMLRALAGHSPHKYVRWVGLEIWCRQGSCSRPCCC